MLQLNAAAFLELMMSLLRLEYRADASIANLNVALTAKQKEDFAKHFLKVKGTLTSLELEQSLLKEARIASRLEDDGYSWNDMIVDTRELRQRVEDEMQAVKFLVLDKGKADWYAMARPVSEEAAYYLPMANRELAEAAKCIAVDQYTASVFHAMRATEVAVKVIYRTLDIPAPKLTDSWGKMLEPMDEQLNRNSTKPKNANWTAERLFFNDIVNDLKSIKRVWRDTTMHVENDYDENQAEKVYYAVESFICKVAMRLDEAGEFHIS
jgi:HEPN domain-containing protein